MTLTKIGPPGAVTLAPGETIQLDVTADIWVRRSRRFAHRACVGRVVLTSHRFVVSAGRWNTFIWLGLPLLIRPLNGTYQVRLEEITDELVKRGNSVGLIAGDDHIQLRFGYWHSTKTARSAEEWASRIRQTRLQRQNELPP